MKKSILILFAILMMFSLTAFAYINWNNTKTDQERASLTRTSGFEQYLVTTDNDKGVFNLFYNIRNRWSTMTKEDLSNARSIHDILSTEATYDRGSFKNVTISVLHNDKDVRDIEKSEIGQSEVLNDAQINLLHSSDYSTNIKVTALSRRMNAQYDALKYDSLVHYMTIIPEKEAEFAGGFHALIEYIKENSKEKAAIIKRDQLQPGKVFFTVTKKGTIANVKLNSTSGYTSVDEELIKIISNMPQKWNPAENSKGDKVDQEFVFFFGSEGC